MLLLMNFLIDGGEECPTASTEPGTVTKSANNSFSIILNIIISSDVIKMYFQPPPYYGALCPLRSTEDRTTIHDDSNSY